MLLSLQASRAACCRRALAALIATLAVARQISAEPPPWSVESPSGALALGAVGLDGLDEQVDHLPIRSDKSTVTLRDPDGGTSTQRIDTDPALLNRKFKVGWKLRGGGVQLPLALPRLSLGRAFSAYPSLVLQAADVETTLAVRNLREPPQSISLDAHGLLVGGALGLVVPFCKTCSGFAVLGYRYRLAPWLDASSSQGLAGEGFSVARDKVLLRQSTSDLFLRVGQTFAGHVAASLGILARHTRVDVHNELSFGSPLGEGTSLDTRTRYDRRATGVMADLDAHFAGPWYGRAEVIATGGDRSALLKVAYLLPWRLAARPAGALPPGTSSARERSPEALAAAIAGPLRRILDEYRARAAALARADPPYPRAGVASLLDDTERELLAALDGPELAGLRDFVADLFSRAREALALGPAREAAAHLGSAPPTVLPAVFRGRPEAPAARAGEGGGAAAAAAWIQRIGAAIGRLVFLAQTKDLEVDLCIESEPRQGAQFTMHRTFDPPGQRTVNTNHVWRASRGLYAYEARLDGYKTIDSRTVGDRIDLVMQTVETVICRFVAQSDPAAPRPCDQETVRRAGDCAR